MRYHARLSVTLRLILFSLFPDFTPDQPPVIPVISDSFCAVSPEVLLNCLRNSDIVTSLAEARTIVVPGAFFLAAPFILFRLKRWGFSGCRVCAEHKGLCLEVRR